MIDSIARWIAKHPKIVLIVCLILIIPSAIGYFNTFINYDILTYLPTDLNSVQGEQVLDETFHNAASAIIIVEDTAPKDIARLKEKISAVEGVSQVMWIDSVVDISVPAEMLPDFVRDIFYSADGNSTMMMVQFDGAGASEETMDAIGEIRTLMNEHCFMSGMSAIMKDTKDLADSQAPLYVAIAIVLALIVLSFTLNSWVLPFILLAALGTAVIYNMGTNIFFGQISYITQCIAAILQLGVTMDYSVFLIDRFEEERLKGDSNTAAMARAISGTFTSLCGSSLTTVFGFLALCFMSFTLGLDIGLVMAKGVLLGVLTVVTFLPALVLLCNDKIESTRHKSVVPKFDRLNAFTIKHRRIFAVLFLLLFIPSFIASQNVDVYYNMDRALPDDLPSISALHKMKDEFNMATTHFVIVDNALPAKELTQMTDEIRAVDGITNVISLNTFVGTAIPTAILPEEILDICVQGGKQLMMVNTSYSAATDEENAQIDALKEIALRYDPNGYLTGEGAMTKDLVEVTNRDFVVTNIISVAAIFLLVAIIFKSISIPAILVASIELAIFVNEAISCFMGTTIPFIAPTVIGCVQLGATVDYAILMTTRFREELQRGTDRKQALYTAANQSCRSIFQSALVFFAATFGVYMICDISLIQSICAMLARGAIISALVIIVLLTPVLYVCEPLIHKTTWHWRTPPVPKGKGRRKKSKHMTETEA